eukprot:6184200-Pleurochrysis_carterae.AAC.4
MCAIEKAAKVPPKCSMHKWLLGTSWRDCDHETPANVSERGRGSGYVQGVWARARRSGDGNVDMQRRECLGGSVAMARAHRSARRIWRRDQAAQSN